MRIATLSIAAALLLGGCTSEFAFTDSVSSKFMQASPRADFGDELSTPYVLGSEFTIYVQDRQHGESMTGWTLRVTNPEILKLRDPEPRWVDRHTLALDVEAIGAGTTELLLLDASGEVKGSGAVEVRLPTRVKLYATAIAALENPDYKGETPHPHLLAGGTASFGVQYIADDLLLQGATKLKLVTEPTIVADVVRSPSVDNRDILQITAGDPGRDTIGLWLGEYPLGTVVVDVVGPDRVAAIDLIEHKGSTQDEAEGDWLVVAQAYDEDRQPIYGVGFDWSFPGRSFEQLGDILIYEHDADPSKRKDVVARAAGRESTISVQAADGEVFTSNDEAFNCNVGGAGNGGIGALWAVMLACAGLRRRRRAR